MTYTSLSNLVWYGSEFVCRAASDKYAAAIAEAMNEWQRG